MRRSIINNLFVFGSLCIVAAIQVTDSSASDALEVTVKAEKVQLAFETKSFEVESGQSVKLTLVNPDGGLQPHNLLIISPDKTNEVGMLANQGITNPEFLKNPVPESEHVLFSTKLLQPGDEETIEFKAPSEPGEYPYICTYPGHWMVMKGIMKVVK
ncbi:MAG: plastocyanin/azurin family copper-binding protein [Verrucomicrobiota bacterium]